MKPIFFLLSFFLLALPACDDDEPERVPIIPAPTPMENAITIHLQVRDAEGTDLVEAYRKALNREYVRVDGYASWESKPLDKSGEEYFDKFKTEAAAGDTAAYVLIDHIVGFGSQREDDMSGTAYFRFQVPVFWGDTEWTITYDWAVELSSFGYNYVCNNLQVNGEDITPEEGSDGATMVITLQSLGLVDEEMW